MEEIILSLAFLLNLHHFLVKLLLSTYVSGIDQGAGYTYVFYNKFNPGGAISQFSRHILTVSASFHTESATTILHVSAMITSHCRRRGSAFDQPTYLQDATTI